MSFRVLAGPRLNVIGRGASYGSTPTAGVAAYAASGALDSAYPIANVYDGIPSSPIRWDTRTTSYGLDVVTNLLTNGDFEQSSLTGWTSSSATLTTETGAGNYLLGSRSMKVVTSAIGGGAYQDVQVDAGMWLQIRAGIKSDNVNAAGIRVQNLNTGNWLQSNGTWSTAADALTRTTNTMAALTPLAFQVESAATCGTTEPWLRVWARGSANPHTFYVDELLLVQGYDFVGVFGHGLPAFWTMGANKAANYWHGGASSTIWSDVTNFPVRQSVYYLNASVVYEPFVSLRWTGSQAIAASQPIPWLGEVVLGQTVAITNPDYPFAMEFREPQIRLQSAGGAQWVANRGPGPLRKATLALVYTTDAQYAASRDVIFRGSRGGANPIILIPTETDSGEVLYGRIEDTVVYSRTMHNRREAGFVVQEEPLPLIW